jgi:hypothetical protein
MQSGSTSFLLIESAAKRHSKRRRMWSGIKSQANPGGRVEEVVVGEAPHLGGAATVGAAVLLDDAEAAVVVEDATDAR